MSRSANKPEKVEERKFTTKVRLLGGEVLKQGGAGIYGIGGYNDRLALCPGGAAVFLEFKRITDGKAEEPTLRQQSRHKKLQGLGFRTFVVTTAKRALWHCRIAMRDHGVPIKIRKRWRV